MRTRHLSQLALLLVLPCLSAGPLAASEWKISGDVRGGVMASERTARNGAETDDDLLRVRLRVAFERALDERLSLRFRVAGKYEDGQDGMRAYLRASPPVRAGGIAAGDTTLDEAYLRVAVPGSPWSARLGRFQTEFNLMGVAPKSLDRNDSPSMDVGWTDGVHLQRKLGADWIGHLIVQHNPSSAPGTPTRAPLDFSDGDTRASLFAGLQNATAKGPWVQRMLGFTWYPNALATDGLAAPRREDYLTLTARSAWAFPWGEGGRRWVVGGELGHAFNTPQGSVVGTGRPGSTGGTAWQASVNLDNFRPGHRIGLVYGEADGGWLITPDYRNNDALAELRYQYRFNPNWSMEVRYRWREELQIPANALRPRVDRDAYVRVSGRF